MSEELCECGHAVAKGYITCLCCLHGTCPEIHDHITKLEARDFDLAEQAALSHSGCVKRIAELETRLYQTEEYRKRIVELEAKAQYLQKYIDKNIDYSKQVARLERRINEVTEADIRRRLENGEDIKSDEGPAAKVAREIQRDRVRASTVLPNRQDGDVPDKDNNQAEPHRGTRGDISSSEERVP